MNVSANEFTDIDLSNRNALKEGLSLFDIVENAELDSSKYLENKTGETCLTLKKNGAFVEIKNDQSFIIIELKTDWV